MSASTIRHRTAVRSIGEMAAFIAWFNAQQDIDPVLKAASPISGS